ncbi:unnamed protein product [Clonostachys rosea f. rosea IK726]|uniref:Uncharacterized protein n=1 Tax=Clonostachys rosea f. rosea IK726 TaxID=1349383 RepID=A0ACA9U5S4_BIOOC|nr:unnamed protein product [Clonostachys rosea f. rosea IK726]
MLPTRLLSVYEEYKKDTNSVAAWLASTARAAGCPLSLLTDCPPASGRLKGKERKLAKLKKLSQDSKKYIIPVSNFIPLAEYVTSQKSPAIPVPACVISAIERAISARAGFATQLSHQGETLDAEKDETHSHFVTVLKRTRDILRSKASMSPSPASTPHSASEKAIPDTASINRFASLEINQPSKEFTDMMGIKRPEPVVNDPNVYEAEQTTTFRDARDFAFMLSGDLNAIRDEIVSNWRRFTHDEWDLSAAALASNTGLDLARFIIHQAEPVFEPHGGIVKFFESFNEWLIELVSDLDILPVDELRQRFYLCAKSGLRIGLDLDKNIRPVPPCLANYDPTVSRDQMSDDEMITDDFGFVGNLVLSSASLNRHVEGFPVFDEFTREVGRVLESEQMTFFLLFAGQVFLDINHHIRKDALKAFDKMQQELESIESTLESLLTVTKQASKIHTEMIRRIQEPLRFIKQDELFESADRLAREMNIQPPLSYERHLLYKLSPVLCGLIIFHFRARLYDFSTRPGAITMIQDVAHLYHALHSEDMLDSDWEDLAEIENRLGLSAIFNSKSNFDRPSGTRAIVKSLALQKGTSVSALKRMMNLSDESVQVSFPRRTKKALWSQIPLSVFFTDRYVLGSGRIDMRPEDVERLLSLSKFGSVHGGNGHDPCVVANNTAQGGLPESASTPTKHAKLFPHVLIRELGRELNKESAIIAFPYLVVENLCFEFLRDLSTSRNLWAMQQINSGRFGLPDSPEHTALFILLCDLHKLPINKEVYKMVADSFRSKLSTCWGRAGLNKMSKT